ncbi:MAG: hypothetical protein II494_06455, partial [Bacilli bacterium]|nr:hypothetical protein [Bacilli bacterium]
LPTPRATPPATIADNAAMERTLLFNGLPIFERSPFLNLIHFSHAVSMFKDLTQDCQSPPTRLPHFSRIESIFLRKNSDLNNYETCINI